MDHLNRLDYRIDKLYNSIGNVNIKDELYRLNQRIENAFQTLPNLAELASLDISKYETDNVKINLILANYQQYKSLGEKLLNLNAIDINKLDLKMIDVQKVIDQKVRILNLVSSFLTNLVHSLIVVEKFITFINSQNQFLLQTNSKILSLKRQLRDVEHQY